MTEPTKYTQIPSGCWVACIAGVTGLPFDELCAFVPQELVDEMLANVNVDEKWIKYHNAVNAYTRAHGWRYADLGPDIPHGFAIGVGKAARGCDHAVIAKDGVLWWDPHPSREGLISWTSFEVWVPIVGQLR